MDRLALRFAGAPDESRVLEDGDVLRDGLQRDRERLGQFAERRRAPAEPSDDGAADRIGERGEGPIECTVLHIHQQILL
jgi:hypothetical protein